MTNKKICPICNSKMRQQFIGLLHCKCGISYHKDLGYFKRNEKVPVIRYKKDK